MPKRYNFERKEHKQGYSIKKKKTPDLSTIGGRIAALRAERGISQAVLAGVVFHHITTISEWENNHTHPDPEDIVRLAEFFKVDKGYLLCDYPERTKDNNLICQQIGLSETAVNVLRSLNICGQTNELDFMSSFLTTNVSDPSEPSEQLILLSAIVQLVYPFYSYYSDQIPDRGSMWDIQDMFMDFIKNYIKEKKSASD